MTDNGNFANLIRWITDNPQTIHVEFFFQVPTQFFNGRFRQLKEVTHRHFDIAFLAGNVVFFQAEIFYHTCKDGIRVMCVHMVVVAPYRNAVLFQQGFLLLVHGVCSACTPIRIILCGIENWLMDNKQIAVQFRRASNHIYSWHQCRGNAFAFGVRVADFIAIAPGIVRPETAGDIPEFSVLHHCFSSFTTPFRS